MKGWALRTPSGKLMPGTFAETRYDAWGLAFHWMKPYYKRWNPSINAAKRRGYVLVRVVVTEAK